MDKQILYKIRVESHLSKRWSDWFKGVMIYNETNGNRAKRTVR